MIQLINWILVNILDSESRNSEQLLIHWINSLEDFSPNIGNIVCICSQLLPRSPRDICLSSMFGERERERGREGIRKRGLKASLRIQRGFITQRMNFAGKSLRTRTNWLSSVFPVGEEAFHSLAPPPPLTKIHFFNQSISILLKLLHVWTSFLFSSSLSYSISFSIYLPLSI